MTATGCLISFCSAAIPRAISRRWRILFRVASDHGRRNLEDRAIRGADYFGRAANHPEEV
jgi:hypothetical protein